MAGHSGVRELAKAVREGDRAALARAITLVESTSEEDLEKASSLITQITPATGDALRIGITGVPGVGKSTLIDRLGAELAEGSHKVGVLAVDPSSELSGGSILGDKTRMHRLAAHENAFVRPSPTGGKLGGVARATREAIMLMEAAGHDIVMVETVGTGQSETEVAGMVDVFVLLMLPGAGDELQGIKKGVMELADIIVVHKADGQSAMAAKRAVSDYQAAFHLQEVREDGWRVPILAASSETGDGLEKLWFTIMEFRGDTIASGTFEKRRAEQQVRWMRALAREETLRRAGGKSALEIELADEVRAGRISAADAAKKLADG